MKKAAASENVSKIRKSKMSLAGAKFICLDVNGARGEVILAKGRTFTIGYYMNCDYVVSDLRAKGVHCKIQCDAYGRVTIHNMSEEHPIAINGKVVDIKRPLLNGTRISAFDREFLWEFPGTSSQVSTPQKQVGIPEQPPSSCPNFLMYRGRAKRFTVHNFAYCIKSDDKQNQAQQDESAHSTQLPQKSEAPATICVVAASNKARSVTPEPVPSTGVVAEELQRKVTPRNDTQKTQKLLSLCQESATLITSYSPRKTGFCMEKSFTHFVSAATPRNIYSTPQRIMNDDSSRDFIDFVTPGTSKKVLLPASNNGSMHLIDLTMSSKRRPASPLPKSALKIDSIKKNLLPTPKTAKALGLSQQQREQLGVPPVTPSFDNGGSATDIPSSAESVISVASSDEASVIELSDADYLTPTSTSADIMKTLATPCQVKMSSKVTTRRTPQSLIKRALISSATKHYVRAQPTPTSAAMARATTRLRTPQSSAATSSTRLSMSAPTMQKTVRQLRMDSPGPSTSQRAPQLTSTPLSTARRRTTAAMANDSPLHKVRKSISSTSRDTWRSSTVLKKCSPQALVAKQIVAKARQRALKSPRTSASITKMLPQNSPVPHVSIKKVELFTDGHNAEITNDAAPTVDEGLTSVSLNCTFTLDGSVKTPLLSTQNTEDEPNHLNLSFSPRTSMLLDNIDETLNKSDELERLKKESEANSATAAEKERTALPVYEVKETTSHSVEAPNKDASNNAEPKQFKQVVDEDNVETLLDTICDDDIQEENEAEPTDAAGSTVKTLIKILPTTINKGESSDPQSLSVSDEHESPHGERVEFTLAEHKPQLSEDEEKENKIKEYKNIETSIKTTHLEMSKKHTESQPRLDKLHQPQSAFDECFSGGASYGASGGVLPLTTPTKIESSGAKTAKRSNRRASLPSGAVIDAKDATAIAAMNASFTPKRMTRRASLSIAESGTIIEAICTPKRITKRRPSICLEQTPSKLKTLCSKRLTLATVDFGNIIPEEHVEETLAVAEAKIEIEGNVTEPISNDANDSGPSADHVHPERNVIADNNMLEESFCEVISDSECIHKNVNSPQFGEQYEITAKIPNDDASFGEVVGKVLPVRCVEIKKINDSDSCGRNYDMANPDPLNIFYESDYDYGKEVDDSDADAEHAADKIYDNVAPQLKETGISEGLQVKVAGEIVMEPTIVAKSIVLVGAAEQTVPANKDETKDVGEAFESLSAVNIIKSSSPEPTTPVKDQGSKGEVLSPSTPPMQGVRELLRTPKVCAETPKLGGLRHLLRTPKCQDTENVEGLQGISALMRTPKMEVKHELSEKDDLDESPSTSANAHEKNNRGVREQLETAKICSTPLLKGVPEMMMVITVNDSPLATCKEDTMDTANLVKYLKSPSSKNLMMSQEPASVELQRKSNESVNGSVFASIECDLGQINTSLNLEDIFKTPTPGDFSARLEATESEISEECAVVSELNIRVSPSSASYNVSTDLSFDKLAGQPTVSHLTPPKNVYARKSFTHTVQQSPFSEADVLSDLPKTDVQEWVDSLEGMNTATATELDGCISLVDEQELTVTGSMIGCDNGDLSCDPLSATASMLQPNDSSIYQPTDTSVNVFLDEVVDNVVNASTAYGIIDPLSCSMPKKAFDQEDTTQRPATLNEDDISGINFLDETTESECLEPLIVSDCESVEKSIRGMETFDEQDPVIDCTVEALSESLLISDTDSESKTTEETHAKLTGEKSESKAAKLNQLEKSSDLELKTELKHFQEHSTFKETISATPNPMKVRSKFPRKTLGGLGDWTTATPKLIKIGSQPIRTTFGEQEDLKANIDFENLKSILICNTEDEPSDENAGIIMTSPDNPRTIANTSSDEANSSNVCEVFKSLNIPTIASAIDVHLETFITGEENKDTAKIDAKTEVEIMKMSSITVDKNDVDETSIPEKSSKIVEGKDKDRLIPETSLVPDSPKTEKLKDDEEVAETPTVSSKRRAQKKLDDVVPEHVNTSKSILVQEITGCHSKRRYERLEMQTVARNENTDKPVNEEKTNSEDAPIKTVENDTAQSTKRGSVENPVEKLVESSLSIQTQIMQPVKEEKATETKRKGGRRQKNSDEETDFRTVEKKMEELVEPDLPKKIEGSEYRSPVEEASTSNKNFNTALGEQKTNSDGPLEAKDNDSTEVTKRRSVEKSVDELIELSLSKQEQLKQRVKEEKTTETKRKGGRRQKNADEKTDFRTVEKNMEELVEPALPKKIEASEYRTPVEEASTSNKNYNTALGEQLTNNDGPLEAKDNDSTEVTKRRSVEKSVDELIELSLSKQEQLKQRVKEEKTTETKRKGGRRQKNADEKTDFRTVEKNMEELVEPALPKKIEASEYRTPVEEASTSNKHYNTALGEQLTNNDGPLEAKDNDTTEVTKRRSVEKSVDELIELSLSKQEQLKQRVKEEKTTETKRKGGRRQKNADEKTDFRTVEKNMEELVEPALPKKLETSEETSIKPVAVISSEKLIWSETLVNRVSDEGNLVEVSEMKLDDMPKRGRGNATVARRAIAGGSRLDKQNVAGQKRTESEDKHQTMKTLADEQQPKKSGRKRKESHTDNSQQSITNSNESPQKPEIIEASSSTPIIVTPKRTRKVSTIDVDQSAARKADDTPQSQRGRNVQRRVAATVEHNYDETSDSEQPFESKQIAIKSSAGKPLVLSSGRIHKPSAKVQQLLEDETGKAETPRRRVAASAVKMSAGRGRKPSTTVEIDEMSATPPVAKRPRGRPPKVTAESSHSDPASSEVDDSHGGHNESAPRKRRGRPPGSKKHQTEISFELENAHSSHNIEKERPTVKAAARGRLALQDKDKKHQTETASELEDTHSSHTEENAGVVANLAPRSRVGRKRKVEPVLTEPSFPQLVETSSTHAAEEKEEPNKVMPRGRVGRKPKLEQSGRSEGSVEMEDKKSVTQPARRGRGRPPKQPKTEQQETEATSDVNETQSSDAGKKETSSKVAPRAVGKRVATFIEQHSTEDENNKNPPQQDANAANTASAIEGEEQTSKAAHAAQKSRGRRAAAKTVTSTLKDNGTDDKGGATQELETQMPKTTTTRARRGRKAKNEDDDEKAHAATVDTKDKTTVTETTAASTKRTVAARRPSSDNPPAVKRSRRRAVEQVEVVAEVIDPDEVMEEEVKPGTSSAAVPGRGRKMVRFEAGIDAGTSNPATVTEVRSTRSRKK